ncbi:MAG TPA: DUF2147 domain-containing protein [Xanthobacteraceae bacterium]|nr:DUF2147 domain-containing protein [Xanthobacteraceae bacterium]
MIFRGLGFLSAVALCAFVGAGYAHADPRGLWLAQDGAKVRVISCGKALCGRIAVAKSPTDPETGRPWTDKDNPDPRLRNRPVVGVEVFISMMPDGPGKWTGRLYNVNGGQTVPGHVIELDRKTIKVEGCAGNMCGSQNMTRIE